MPQTTHDHRGNLLVVGYDPQDIDSRTHERLRYFLDEAKVLSRKAGMFFYAYVPITHPSLSTYRKGRTLQWEENDTQEHPRRFTCSVESVEPCSTDDLREALKNHPDAFQFALTVGVPYKRITLLHLTSDPIPYLKGYRADRASVFQGFMKKEGKP